METLTINVPEEIAEDIGLMAAWDDTVGCTFKSASSPSQLYYQYNPHTLQWRCVELKTTANLFERITQAVEQFRAQAKCQPTYLFLGPKDYEEIRTSLSGNIYRYQGTLYLTVVRTMNEQEPRCGR